MNQFAPVCSHLSCAANYCSEWDSLVWAARVGLDLTDGRSRAELQAMYDDDGESGWDANGSPVEDP